MSYTTAALLAVLASAALDQLLRTRILFHKEFWLAYTIVLVFQLVTNGILTGQGIVSYAAHAVVGTGSRTPPFLGQGRVAYAPVEDLLFGFALVVQTLSWWTFWGRRLGSS